MVMVKVTTSKAEDMLDLLHDILQTGCLDDKERFKQVGPVDCCLSVMSVMF